MNITTFKGEAIGLFHGTTLNQIQGFDGIINRAARQILLDIDPQETKRTLPLASPIYDQVFDYACPVDLKGNRVIDIKPQVQRTLRENFGQVYNKDFDIGKEYVVNSMFTTNFNGSIKTLRIDAPNVNNGLVLNSVDSSTINGTWVASGTASNITNETVNYAAGSGSIKFDLAASGGATTGILTNSTMQAIDMTAHLNQSSLFFYVYLQTASVFSSFDLRWGSDASNYWTANATVTQSNTTFENGWNLIQVNWVNATKVGSPVVTAVNYVQVRYNYDGTAQTGCGLDNIVSQLGKIYQIEYYSKYLFRNHLTNAFQETVTDNANLINLDTESYNLLLYKTAFMVAQQMQGADALRFDATYWDNQYNLALNRYKGLYKSEVTKPRAQYYRQPSVSYRRFFNRRFW